MIKILRIINRFNLGGPTYNASYLTKFMPDEYQTLLIGGVPHKSETDSLHITKNMNIEPLIIPEMSRSINPLNDIKAYYKIRNVIKNYKPDIVHTHASKAGFLGRLAAIHENIPIIVHTFHGHIFHSYFNPLVTKLFLNIESYLARRTSKIIAISELQKKELSEVFKIAPLDKFKVIPLGLDLKKFSENQPYKRKIFREKYNISDDTITIGIVGRLAPIKNHYLLIDAMKILKKHISKKIEVIIIGDGELKDDLMRYITRLGLTSRTKPQQPSSDFYFTSWIKEMDIAYAGLDIITLTSKNEGTPVSLLEAQAAGKMIISTNAGGVKDIVHPKAGVVINDFKSTTLSDALLKAIERYSQWNNGIFKEISPLVIEQYSYQRLVKNMDALYKELLSKK